MLQNYFKTALRNLLRNKMHAILNLSGLGIGLACGLLIALYIASEMRYDRHHENADNIWRVTRTFHNQDGSENLHLSAIAPPFGTLLPQHFPEIQQITRVLKNFGAAVVPLHYGLSDYRDEVEIADLDADGDLDVGAGGGDVLLNDGAGVLGAPAALL